MTEDGSAYRDDICIGHANAENLLNYQELLNNAPIGFFTSTPGGRFLSVNPAMAQMLGYDTPAQLVEAISDIAAQVYSQPDRRAHFKHILETRGEVFNFEHQLRRQDGTCFWVSTNARAIRDEKGKILSYQGFTTAIDDRKRAEAALKEKSQLLQHVLDNMFELVSLADLEGNFKFLATSHTMLGYDLDSLMGRNAFEFVHPDDLADLSAVFHDFIARREESRKVEYRYRKSDGAYLWFETIGRSIRDENGNPKEILFSTRDITERKTAEHALMNSENRAKRQRAGIADIVLDEVIFSGEIPDAMKRVTEIIAQSIGVERASVWMLSDDGSELHCLSLYQASAGRYSSGTVLKTTDFSVYFDTMRAESRIYAEDAQNDPRLRGLTNAYLAPLGITSLLDAGVIIEGSLAGVVCLEHIGPIRKWHSDEEAFTSMAASIVAQVFTNARRKQAEKEQIMLKEQLNQARKMESVGQLAGGVAHDFNNMLNVIMGYAELALENLDESSPLYIKLREIHNAASRSADISRKLLTFARKQVIQPRILDLNETINKGLRILRRLIGEDITLSWQPSPRLWPVKIDPSQIDQVLTNLCVNARDAITGPGKVTVETGKITLDAAYCAAHRGCKPGDYVVLSVSDDGCGIDGAIVDKVFDPFFTTKETGKGTGLGLATVYGIIRQNNGFINVSSEPGRGSTFRVYFPPYTKGPAEAIQDAQHEKPHLEGRETILVVEDEPMNLDICKTMLESLGYRVIATTCPKDAISTVRNYDSSIHLLLTDVVMPVMNGPALSKSIAAINPGIRCLFMSGHTADMISSKGVLEKDLNFIQKPFSVSELSRKVREVLTGTG